MSAEEYYKMFTWQFPFTENSYFFNLAESFESSLKSNPIGYGIKNWMSN